MTAQIPEPSKGSAPAPDCWSCRGRIDASDRHCRHCGMGQGEHVAWYYRPGWIVILTLFAMGPFSLPLIWKTPKLTERDKWIGTGLLALFTIYLIRWFIAFMSALSAALSAAANLGG